MYYNFGVFDSLPPFLNFVKYYRFKNLFHVIRVKQVIRTEINKRYKILIELRNVNEKYTRFIEYFFIYRERDTRSFQYGGISA